MTARTQRTTTNAGERPVSFRGPDAVYQADTCEPLKAAAETGAVTLHAWGHALYPGTRLPPGFLPAVRSVGVWDAAGPQRWGLDRHCNEGIEFTYLARGRTAFEVDGQGWQLRKGQLTITRPWQFHRVGDPHVGASRLCWAILDVEVRRPNQPWRWPEWLLLSDRERQQLTQLLSNNEQPVWTADHEIEGWFDKLATLLGEGKEPVEGEGRLKLYLNGLLLAILEMLERRQIPLDEYLSSSERAVRLFLDALPEQADHEWTLAGMAQQCGLSRSQFSAYCRRLTGMSPVQYLTNCRVERAAQLLCAEPGRSITEIALQCGFNSSQYFAAVFRAAKGCTPSSYAARL